jgi:peptide/nickel transport system substrate-binding protein
VGERFSAYFRQGLPYLDGFKALSLSPSSTVNALSAGQVMLDFRGVSPAEAERVVAARGDKVKVFQADPAISLLFMVAVNTRKPPLDDARVRKALALALDHWQGAKVIERSSAISAVGGLMRPGSAFARGDAELSKLPGFSRDINASRAEARKLLAEAGQTNLKLTFLNRRPWPFFGVYLIDQLRQIGVTVAQDTPEDPLFFSRRAAGAYDLVLDALPDYMDDPTIQWPPFTSFEKNSANSARYNDPAIDALFERQSRALQPAERLRLVRQMEELVLNRAYVLPLFWGRRTTVVASALQGYVAAPTNYVGIDLTGFWLKK